MRSLRTPLTLCSLAALVSLSAPSTKASAEPLRQNDILEHAGGSPVTPAEHVARAGIEGRQVWPLTVAESSGYSRSSRTDDVSRFLDELTALPQAARLTRRSIGTTAEGRDLVAITVRGAESETERSTVLINANIHGGEIEGKVAVQILLREFALGYHADVLERLEVTFVPIYNADGNDKIARTNRVTQNGPDGGVGNRANAAGLDLNRDFIKVESNEAAALMGLANELQPIAFMDLHTTNGSDHGYDLTYAPSLSPNAAPSLDAYARGTLFPEVRAALSEQHGIETFDYGNFGYAPRERGSRGERGDPIRWSTYDSRPRFGTNLMGLRDTVAILSEAYSYVSYERRIQATYAFVLECLRTLARDRDRVVAAIDGAQASRDAAAEGGVWQLGVGAELAAGEPVSVRLRRIDTVTVDLDPETEGVQEGRRRVAGPVDTVRLVMLEPRVSFRPGRHVDVGAGWVIAEPDDAVRRALKVHLGSVLEPLTEAIELEVDVFQIDSASRSRRPFQGHRESTVTGKWSRVTRVFPVGSIVVPSTPLTAHLLHPESDDSFTTWNLFDYAIFGTSSEEEGVMEGASHPAWRIPTASMQRFDR